MSLKNYGNHMPHGPYEKWVKRPLDCCIASLILILLSPLLGCVAILVRIKHGSPILFKQDRPGKEERIFKLYKFRSLSNKRDKDGKLLPDDERITKFGRLLRSTSIDELPELFNIIKGDMAFIGPRPLLVEYLPFYSEQERHRHDVRPGLSGLAQIHGRNASTWEEKFYWDLKYVENITFFGDLKIVAMTVIKVFKRADILVGKQIPAGRLDNARKTKIDNEKEKGKNEFKRK